MKKVVNPAWLSSAICCKSDWADRLAGAGSSISTGCRHNVRAFTGRLREVGFYRDLSDAYVTQTITPRFRIAEGDTATGGTP